MNRFLQSLIRARQGRPRPASKVGPSGRSFTRVHAIQAIAGRPIECTVVVTIVAGWIAVFAVAIGRANAPHQLPTNAPTAGISVANHGDPEAAPPHAPRTIAHGSPAVAIPPGIYEPFYKSETGARPVPVAAFSLDERPVTKGEFLEFVRANPAWRRSHATGLLAEPTYLKDWQDDLDPGGALDDPVTFVSWFAAQAYCACTGRRLPTVAEWERVAAEQPGRTEGEAASASLTAGSSEIAGYAASPFAFAMGRTLSDASGPRWPAFGAIWEWTQDFNSNLVSGRLGEKTAANLFCGAGVQAVDATDYGRFLRYSFRSSLRANYTLKNLGFRCAQDR